MPTNDASPAGRDDHAIVSGRTFAASREAVFAACSDPVRLAAWWGPQGFTNRFHQFDFRPGGDWRFTMHGPEGAAYEMHHRFLEIQPPERIVLRHLQAGHDFNLEMTFVAREESTELTWRMRFDDPAEAGKLRNFLIPANEQNLDKLAAHLSGGDGTVR